MRRNGQRAGPALRSVLEDDPGWLRCDSLGCLYRPRAGSVIAVVREPLALAEDCRASDLVISLVPVRGPCAAPSGVIDRFDLWRDGPHGLWIDGKDQDPSVTVWSVRAWRGDRPWTPARPARGR